MEWTGNKKLIRWIVIWIVTGGVLLLSMAAVSYGCELVKRKQLAQILISHPDLEAELIDRFYCGEEIGNVDLWSSIIDEKYGYSICNEVFSKNNLRLWGAVYLCVSLGLGIFLLLDGRKLKVQRQKEAERLLWIEESIEELKKGNYDLKPCVKSKLESDERTERWDAVCSGVMELGAQMELVKRRLAEEETNTKSFVTNLSHQLKTPLASLKISHELADSRQLSGEEQERFFRQEGAEIEKINGLLDELVKLSHLENHQIKLMPQKAGLKETIVQAVNQVYQKAYLKKIEIQVEMERDYEVIHDRKWTVEVLVNVLDNAIKYSPEHKSIVLRVVQLPMNLLVEIEDEGIGIPSEEMHRIFHRFYRGREAAKYAKEGAGVGLALARNIIEQQHGTISAKRKPENGTVFRITLPV